MTLRLFLFIGVLLFSAVLPQNVSADYFLWTDPQSKLTVTFPDTWLRLTDRNPLDVLTIAAPSDGDDAKCVIRTAPDERFVIFPPDYGRAVQKKAVSVPFWQSYMALYHDYDIGRVYDGGGLGRWIASYATAAYTTYDGTVLKPRRALMFASLYYDTLYIVECSALAASYDEWEPDFRSIIKSIDFEKIYHSFLNGYYADFLRDADQYFWSQTGPEGTVGYN